jgi:hypothetical protein
MNIKENIYHLGMSVLDGDGGTKGVLRIIREKVSSAYASILLNSKLDDIVFVSEVVNGNIELGKAVSNYGVNSKYLRSGAIYKEDDGEGGEEKEYIEMYDLLVFNKDVKSEVKESVSVDIGMLEKLKDRVFSKVSKVLDEMIKEQGIEGDVEKIEYLKSSDSFLQILDLDDPHDIIDAYMREEEGFSFGKVRSMLLPSNKVFKYLITDAEEVGETNVFFSLRDF